jgi:predicted phosphatase
VDAIVNIEFDIKNFAKPSMVDYFNDKDYLKNILPNLGNVKLFSSSDQSSYSQDEYVPQFDEYEDAKT